MRWPDHKSISPEKGEFPLPLGTKVEILKGLGFDMVHGDKMEGEIIGIVDKEKDPLGREMYLLYNTSWRNAHNGYGSRIYAFGGKIPTASASNKQWFVEHRAVKCQNRNP